MVGTMNNVNSLYDGMIIEFMKDIKLSAAHKAIKEITTKLITSGYSKEELRQYLSLIVEEDK